MSFVNLSTVDWVPILTAGQLFVLCVFLLTITSGWIFYRSLVAVGLIAMAVIVDQHSYSEILHKYSPSSPVLA